MSVTGVTLTCRIAILEIKPWVSQMAAIVKLLSRSSGTQVDVETLITVAMFCAVGLFVSLLAASYGLDLGTGFF